MPTTHSHPSGPTIGADHRHPIGVLIVDDHPAVRHGVASLVEQQPDMAVTATAGSADHALAAGGTIDVAVVDYHLDARDGLWLTRQLKQLDQPPRVLIYSAFADHTLAIAATIAGADGLLGKGTLAEELCIAIHQLARGRSYFPDVPVSFTRAQRARLEPCDHALFDMLVDGRAADELHVRLGISHTELDVRRQAILRVLANRRASVQRAYSPLDYERLRRRNRRRGA